MAICKNNYYEKWKQYGDGKHDSVEISARNGQDSIRHVVSRDKAGGKKIVSQTFNSSDKKKESGHTTIHGNGHVNKHGSHNR